MAEVTNLDRAMVAETTLHDYSNNKEPSIDRELYDIAESVCIDMIADVCHLLHLDEKTAGLMDRVRIRQLLDTAYNHFIEEVDNAS